MSVPIARAAGALLAIEAVGLLALAGWQVVALLGEDTMAAASAIALIVLTVVGAVAVAAFAGAVWTARSWGRSGGIVTQLLILAVAVGAVTGPYPQVGTALLLAAPALLGIGLLLAAARSAHRESPDPSGR
ncbi:histidine kinase [Microbacterium lacusdiani]|jgi:hypothetical protein